jgi:hypothetical protein
LVFGRLRQLKPEPPLKVFLLWADRYSKWSGWPTFQVGNYQYPG